MEKNSRIVRGICDAYKVYRSIDAISGKEVLEAHVMIKVDEGVYEEKYLGEIDGSFNDSDDSILNEIDARFDVKNFTKSKALNS